MSEQTTQPTTDPVLDALFAEGEMAKSAVDKTGSRRLNPINVGSTVKGLHKEGYTPELLAYGTAAGLGGWSVRNYIKNLDAVKKSIEAEQEALKALKTPPSQKTRQPFAKDGFVMQGSRDMRSVLPQRRGAGLPITRLSNVVPVGGPEGTGVGVLKGREKGAALRMTAEQMIKYLKAQTNYGVTATTPRIQIQGVQEGKTGRQKVVVTPEDVKAGKIPKTSIPAGEPLPPPKPTVSARAIRAIPNAVYSGGKTAVNFARNMPNLPAKVGGVLAPIQIAQQIDALYEDDVMDREHGKTDPLALRPLVDLALSGIALDQTPSQAWGAMGRMVGSPEWQMRNPVSATYYNMMHGNFQPLKAFAGGYVPEFIARRFR
jgi:hypothetical protein